MVGRANGRGTLLSVGLLGALLTTLGGCVDRDVGPALIENGLLGPMSIAVAPALNLSGSADFDPQAFADVMASELSYVEGIEVIPVSRVLGVLSAQEAKGVESATHALELRDLLGADAILVFAVTEYDPYDPPAIGITAQLYGSMRDAEGPALDPVTASRQASFVASEVVPTHRTPLAQAQRVFDAGHTDVVQAIRGFARQRDSDENPFGWRKYVVSQRDYIRFCCHETVKTLMRSSDQLELTPASAEQ